jgi:hypothetical protein
MLVDGFVNVSNSYRESISCWYGQGDYWINHGLSQYIAINPKPEFGCKVQNSACGQSGIMMRLKMVKTMEAQQAKLRMGDGGLLHGAAVLKSLVLPWTRADRIVCADLYFALVRALQELKRIGLRFIGVVKTATPQFPQSFLSHLEMTEQGSRRGLIAKDKYGTSSMLAFCWMDRDCCYFITSALSLQPGRAYSQSCWQQVSEVQNAELERINLQISRPEAVELYYAACGTID